MRQAMHIFKKDVRYLRNEIGLVIVLMALFASMNLWWVEFLLMLAMAYLIVRVVQAETIPGQNQFWITRPYQWGNLLAAKLLFIVLFVHLPICLAQFYLTVLAGFPLASILPGLVWSQVLMIGAVSLPVAALSTMTAGIMPMIFSAFVLLTVGLSVLQRAIRAGIAWPASVEWIRDVFAFTILALLTLTILYLQYRNRRTFFSVVLAVTVAVAGGLACWYMPVSLALALQAKLSKKAFDGSALQISLPAKSKQPSHQWKTARVPVQLPITVAGIPAGVELIADSVAVSIDSGGGRKWESESDRPASVNRQTSQSGNVTYHTTAMVDPRFFNDVKDRRVQLHASIYFTAFGNTRSRTIPLQNTPQNVMDGLQCYLGAFDVVTCRSAFQWPVLLVYSQFGDRISYLTRMVSYSPVPGGLDLNPIISHWATSAPASAREVTIGAKEPLAHFRRDIDLHDVHLPDFTEFNVAPR